jgi:hypothetical protein
LVKKQTAQIPEAFVQQSTFGTNTQDNKKGKTQQPTQIKK